METGLPVQNTVITNENTPLVGHGQAGGEEAEGEGGDFETFQHGMVLLIFGFWLHRGSQSIILQKKKKTGCQELFSDKV